MAHSITGVVASDKTDKTIVISVATRKTHPVYRKQYTLNTKFMAHDQKNEAKAGDLVVITACRPLSARKRFTLTKILERGGIRFEEADATADIAIEEPEVVATEPVKPKQPKKTDSKKTTTKVAAKALPKEPK